MVFCSRRCDGVVALSMLPLALTWCMGLGDIFAERRGISGGHFLKQGEMNPLLQCPAHKIRRLRIVLNVSRSTHGWDWTIPDRDGAEMAEGEGFEPPVPFQAQRFSRPSV